MMVWANLLEDKATNTTMGLKQLVVTRMGIMKWALCQMKA